MLRGLIDGAGGEPTMPGAYIRSLYGPTAGRTAILSLTAIAPSLESVLLSGNNKVILEDNSLGQQPEPVSHAGYFEVITKKKPETVMYTFQVTGRDGTIYQDNEVVTFSGNLEDRIPRHNAQLYGPWIPAPEGLAADVNFYACDLGDNVGVKQLRIYKNNERIFYADDTTNPSGDFNLAIPEESFNTWGKGVGTNIQGWIHTKRQQNETDVFKIEYVDAGNHVVSDSVVIGWSSTQE